MMNQNDDSEGRELSDELEAHRKQLDAVAGFDVVNVERFEKMLEPHDVQLRAPGCLCDQEEGDSPCPVHGLNEEMEADDLNDSNDFEVKP